MKLPKRTQKKLNKIRGMQKMLELQNKEFSVLVDDFRNKLEVFKRNEMD